ncbi:MAG: HPr(Ser) kinase/phosphatase [Clostridia bacterium]|nr:HPr(Ser) kinase/phosphatase [Clostridia bacterium]
MEDIYSVPLSEVIREHKLEAIYLPQPAEEIMVCSTQVNRPGLPLVGFFDHFEKARLEIIGKVEYLYLKQLYDNERRESLEKFFAAGPVGVVLTTGLEAFDEMRVMAQKYRIPLLRTNRGTSDFMAALIAYLNVALAPRITRHGVLVNIYGEGVLLLGDSGIGKSETAIELLKRGHRLIADDAVEIKRVSSKTLVGSAPEIIRHYVELRGIGIVDVCRLFGMGAVENTAKIELIVNLEPWENGKMYDRLGLDNEMTDILGVQIPSITLPVCPGRNIAVVLEIAAMNHRQKMMGYNTAEEFNRRLMAKMGMSQEDIDAASTPKV